MMLTRIVGWTFMPTGLTRIVGWTFMSTGLTRIVGWTFMSTGPIPSLREIGSKKVRSGICRWLLVPRHGGHECPPYGDFWRATAMWRH